MNTHTIPPEIARRVGLDNMEPSGLEGDRRLADLAANEAAEKADGAQATPEAAPLELADLEDLVCRVRWMLKAAWDELAEMRPGEGGDVDTKVRHLVRAANELMLELHADYYDALEGRAAQ